MREQCICHFLLGVTLSMWKWWGCFCDAHVCPVLNVNIFFSHSNLSTALPRGTITHSIISTPSTRTQGHCPPRTIPITPRTSQCPLLQSHPTNNSSTSNYNISNNNNNNNSCSNSTLPQTTRHQLPRTTAAPQLPAIIPATTTPRLPTTLTLAISPALLTRVV